MSTTVSTNTLRLESMPLKKISTWIILFALSAFIAVSAKMQIPLPFSPIPMTCQTFALMLISATCGVQYTCFAVSLYLAEALIGIPVLSEGTAGLASFFGPKGGYIIGFLVQAYITSTLMTRFKPKRGISFFSYLVLGDIVQMSLGTIWLSIYAGNMAIAFSIGFLPFFIGELIKAFCVTALLRVCVSRKKQV